MNFTSGNAGYAVGFNGTLIRTTLTTGSPEITDQKLSIYPNPATNFVVVYNYSSEAGRIIELYDVKGRKVKQQAANGVATRMETSELPSGMYVLRITTASGTILRTEKLMINK